MKNKMMYESVPFFLLLVLIGLDSACNLTSVSKSVGPSTGAALGIC